MRATAVTKPTTLIKQSQWVKLPSVATHVTLKITGGNYAIHIKNQNFRILANIKKPTVMHAILLTVISKHLRHAFPVIKAMTRIAAAMVLYAKNVIPHVAGNHSALITIKIPTFLCAAVTKIRIARAAIKKIPIKLK